MHRKELPQQHVCKEEEEVLCNQERSSSLDQEEPGPPQIKEEEEEHCSSQEGEQLVLEQDTETFMLTPVDEEDDHSEDQTLDWNPDETLEESGVDMSVINSVVSEENRDLQLLSNSSHVAESQDQKGGDHEYSRPPGDEEGKLNNQQQEPFVCKTCGKRFRDIWALGKHIRIHPGERPYICSTCEKDFRRSSDLTTHMRTHTGEKPYSCSTCGKGFSQSGNLTVHMRIHTGKKPYIFNTCRKDFRQSGNLTAQEGMHTVEKPFTCKICGKAFATSSILAIHVRRVHK